MSKKKLLFFSLFKIESIDDQGIYPDLLGQFSLNNFDIYILSPSERGDKITKRIIKKDNVTIIQVKSLKTQKTNKVEKLLSSLSLEFLFLRSYRKELINIEFDVVLFPTPTIFVNNFLNKIKLSKDGFKYLLLKDIFPQNAVDLNFMKSNSFVTRFFEKIENKLYNNVDYIGCMSPENKRFLINNRSVNKNKVEVNPNSLDLSRYPILEKDTFRKSKNILKDDLIFVYGGNLGKPQGIEKIMKLAKYLETQNSIYFIICGKGTESNNLNNFIKKENLKKTKLYSNLTKLEYLQIVKESNMGFVFLHKSFSIPNYPSRILDYMNYKLPVFSWTDNVSDVGDVFINNNAGFSFKYEDDFSEIKSVINNLIPQELRMMGENSYKVLVNNFQSKKSYELIAKKLK